MQDEFDIIFHLLRFNPEQNTNLSWFGNFADVFSSSFLMVVFNILAIYIILSGYLLYRAKTKKTKFSVKIILVFGLAGCLCSLIDKIFWGGSLDFLQIPNLNTPYVVRILWGTTTWPDGTGEGTSLHEWFQANGEISQIQVFLDDVIPTDDLCKAPAINILQTEPNVHYITFFRLSSDGFANVVQGSEPIDIYQEESSKDWSQIWRVDYGQWDLEE